MAGYRFIDDLGRILSLLYYYENNKVKIQQSLQVLDVIAMVQIYK